MPAASATRQSGFTLLEVLVALAVLGLLVLGLSQGVRAGLALRQAQDRHLGNTAELDATMRLLRRTLSRLPALPDGNALLASDAGDAFAGEADRVSFVGDLPTGFGAARRADMTLIVRDGMLLLSWVPHRHAVAPAAPSAAETVLLRGVERLDLAYWGSPDGEPAGWQARWAGPAAPELIRLRLRFQRGDPRHWPDLIVAPAS